MLPERDCGPEGDAAFLDELAAIFERYPEAARKYNVRCVDHEKDMMKIDFTKMEGSARIEGDRVITEFLAKEKTLDPASSVASGSTPGKWVAAHGRAPSAGSSGWLLAWPDRRSVCWQTSDSGSAAYRQPLRSDHKPCMLGLERVPSA